MMICIYHYTYIIYTCSNPIYESLQARHPAEATPRDSAENKTALTVLGLPTTTRKGHLWM